MNAFVAYQRGRRHSKRLGEMAIQVGKFIASSYQCDFTPLEVLAGKWPEYEWSEVSDRKNARGFPVLPITAIQGASYYWPAGWHGLYHRSGQAAAA